jgi:hypothetical protein
VVCCCPPGAVPLPPGWAYRDLVNSAKVTGDELLEDGMHIAIRIRRDFIITDAQRFLAAARAAYLELNPGASGTEAEDIVSSASDAIFTILEQAGILGARADTTLARRAVDGIAPQGQRAQVTINEDRRLPFGPDCFAPADVFALPAQPQSHGDP